MVILTTNQSTENWGQVLGDTAAAGAILDRFLHHAQIIRLQGKSYGIHNGRELISKQAANLDLKDRISYLLTAYPWPLLSRPQPVLSDT